jgi:hypothetical protein
MLEELASGERPIAEVHLPELFMYSIEEGEKKDRLAALIRHLGGWLRVRTNLGIAGDYEQSLLGTDGENFLKHVEEDLSPTKSYKMAVLHALLDEAETGRVRITWPADEIAPAFLSYYLANRRRTKDYSALARSENPGEFPLPKVVTHLKKMPLDKLSNSPGKPFVLDGDSFILKDAYVPFRHDERFRAPVRERVKYAEARNRDTRDRISARRCWVLQSPWIDRKAGIQDELWHRRPCSVSSAPRRHPPQRQGHRALRRGVQCR